MSRLNVNPTRMQLKTLKNRLKIAVRGHKLLKDKTDEMVRRFSVLVKQNYVLRQQTEGLVKEVLKDFCLAKGYMSTQQISSLFALPTQMIMPSFETQTLMNVSIPRVTSTILPNSDLPYSYIDTNAELDNLVLKIKDIVPKLVELASLEKTCQILSGEIERSKRRVNALEFVMIPQLTETIKYISMKIEENDRASRIRLIKVKSMIEKRN